MLGINERANLRYKRLKKVAFNFWEWDTKKVLEATFVGQYKSVGRFKKNVYCFKDKEGKAIHAWSFVQLNNLLTGVPFGTKVKLTYLGMQKMPDSERMFKNFDIDIIDAPEVKKDDTKKKTP